MDRVSRAEVLELGLLKVGIPFAVVSVAGFIYARIIARRNLPKDCLAQTQVISSLKDYSSDGFEDEVSFHSLPSTFIPSTEDEEPTIRETRITDIVENSEPGDKGKFGEVLSLRCQIEDLEKREWKLEKQFVLYCDLKEKESLLMELKNMLLLEMARVEFLDREISSLEMEKDTLADLAVHYAGALEQLERWKSENLLLQRKVKKLLRRTKKQSRVVGEQKITIEAGEAAIARSYDALETRIDAIKKLEGEVRELREILNQMQEEKNELSKKLELAETSASEISKIEGEPITRDAYNQLVNELEQLQKDRADEVKELIFLRWSNACLRHELYKKNHSESHSERFQEIRNYSSLEHETELDGPLLEHKEPSFVAESSEQAYSKRGKLLQRLRRWVEGGEKVKRKLDEKRRHEIRRSASDGAREHFHARRSCSSA